MTNPLSRKGSIWIAALVAVVLVGGAYYFSGHPFPSTQSANAATTQELLKEYATKDSDQDGMPDWEEALYCTDPNNAHSARADLTDSQAIAQGLKTPCYAGQGVTATSTTEDIAGQIPGAAPAANSLTDQFAKLFFNNYMSTRGTAAPTADEMQTFVQEAVTNLEQTRVRVDAFAASNMHVEGSGAESLKAYAAGADAAFTAHTVQFPYDELTYFNDAVEKNDAGALRNVSAIGSAYVSIAQALAQVKTPTEAAAAQLTLVNAMTRLGNTINDLAAVHDDPIRAMLGLQEYPGDATAFVAAFVSMNTVFTNDAVTIPVGTPGWSFYRAVTTISNNAVASQTP